MALPPSQRYATDACLQPIKKYLETVFANADLQPPDQVFDQGERLRDNPGSLVDWVMGLKTDDKAPLLNEAQCARLSLSEQSTAKPRCLYLPLRENEQQVKNNSCYFIYNHFSGSNSTRQRLPEQEITSVKGTRLSHLTGKENAAYSGVLWEAQSKQVYTNVFYKGVSRLLQEPEYILTHKAKNHLLNDPLWLEVQQEDFFPCTDKIHLKQPDGTDYTQNSEDRFFVRFNLMTLNYRYYSSGVESVIVGLRFRDLVIVGQQQQISATLALKVEDLRELIYLLSRPIEQNKQHIYTAKLLAAPAQAENASCQKTTSVTWTRDTPFNLHHLLEAVLPNGTALPESPPPLIYTQFLAGTDARFSKSARKDPYLLMLLLQIAYRKSHRRLSEGYSPYQLIGDPDVEHIITRSGGVVLVNHNVNNREERTFLVNFLENAAASYYRSILQLVYMQYTFLQHADQTLALEPGDDITEQAVAQLRKEQEELLTFRINHVFTDISSHEMYNQIYHAWLNQLRIPELLQQQDKNIADARTLLEANFQRQQLAYQQEREHAEEKHDRNIRNYATVGTAIIFLSGVFGTNFAEMAGENPVSFLSRDWHLVLIGTVALVVAFFIGYINRTPNQRTKTSWAVWLLIVLMIMIAFVLIVVGADSVINTA